MLKQYQSLKERTFSIEENDSYSLLIRLGIRPDKARELIDMYSEERIRQNILHTSYRFFKY
ncbi:hypothetical protein [Bacillus sp. FJAT-45350]|uniref:hypothetical protein n=1 Tax=Bacillus sp. FJAT-45350 TaxID=2011014 RepID=UPI00359C1382